jgi:hypothetical protein
VTTTGTGHGPSAELLARVPRKRQDVERFIGGALPRKLLNVTIVGGTLAVALTAGPAAGGPSFTAFTASFLDGR